MTAHKPTLFIELSSGVVKASTIPLPIEKLLEIGAQAKRSNPKLKVYIKDRTGILQPIE